MRVAGVTRLQSTTFPELLIGIASPQGSKHEVEMQAEATGIHRDGPEAKPKDFLYNIGVWHHRTCPCNSNVSTGHA